MPKMRVVETNGNGPADVLVPGDRPLPSPGAGECLIKVEAAGVNRPDVLQRLGAYPPPPDASDLLGLEVAGVIVDGDLSGSPFQLGDKVCALVHGGGYAQYCVAPVGQCLPVPAGLTPLEAASLPETFFTVWSNVMDRAGLRDQDVLLVQGGTSGIGITAIQLARALGHRVFATAGSDEKARACEALGAERGINYRTEKFEEVVQGQTEGRGVDVILDMVGGAYVPRELNCLAEDGRLVLIALLGGTKAEIPLAKVLMRRLQITGSTLRPRPVEFKSAIARNLHQKVWPLIESSAIKPVIYKTFPLDQAAEAHRLMESSQHIGKIMLAVEHSG